eukprot:2106925-Pleurochrysis_carterae.AAC.1
MTSRASWSAMTSRCEAGSWHRGDEHRRGARLEREKAAQWKVLVSSTLVCKPRRAPSGKSPQRTPVCSERTRSEHAQGENKARQCARKRHDGKQGGTRGGEEEERKEDS